MRGLGRDLRVGDDLRGHYEIACGWLSWFLGGRRALANVRLSDGWVSWSANMLAALQNLLLLESGRLL